MKKTLSLIISLIFIFASSVQAFALEPTEGQLVDLKGYGIMEGDPDGELRLGDNINRSEAVKMACSLLGLVPQDGQSSSFPDIAPGHWASGWIDMAHSIGLVEGDDNGNFRPQDSVTNEEYIKLLVIALGFEPMADARGGFPAGYTMVASQQGITEGFEFEVNAPAKRGDIAIMTARALDIPLMVQTGFGSQIEYSVLDGKNGKDLLTLRYNIDPIAKERGEAARKAEEIANDNADAKEEDVPRFDGDEYEGRLVQVQNLKKIDETTFEFTDDYFGDKVTYVITSDTYVYMSENTIPLSAIENGRYAQIWYRANDNGKVIILKIELMENNPNTAK